MKCSISLNIFYLQHQPLDIEYMNNEVMICQVFQSKFRSEKTNNRIKRLKHDVALHRFDNRSRCSIADKSDCDNKGRNHKQKLSR